MSEAVVLFDLITAAQLAVQYPFLSKLNFRLVSILEENEVDLEMQNLLGKLGAT